MEKVKNGFWKAIDLVYKHKLISFFVAIGIATSFILFNVLADEDQYKNRLYVKDPVITGIQDGTLPFDAEDGTGKDSSATNGIIRNFDSIAYEASYTLELKNGDTITEPIEGRNVVVDVILPKTINTYLTSSHMSGTGQIDALSLDENYNYYEFTIDNASTSLNPGTFSFVLNEVNAQDSTVLVNPIVLILESTDTDDGKKKISDMTEVEKEALINNLPANRVACNSNDVQCITTVTGTYDYDIAFYQGSFNNPTDTITNKKFPIGIGVYISDPKGKFVPSSVSFDLGKEFNTDKLSVSESDFVNYKDSSKDYIIRYNDVNELTNMQNTVTYENGVVTIGNLKYSQGNMFIGTAAFELSSTRSQTDTGDNNIVIKSSNLKIGENVIKQAGGSLTVTDYYNEFVGKFLSKIDIYPGTSLEALTPGAAFLSYGQRFKLKETISYAGDGIGNALDELDTYVKIDPNSFLINKEGSSLSSDLGALKYGHGQWTKDYFELNNVAGCPTNINDLSSEELMNLYGGPCISAKDNVVWTLQSDEEETELPIIIVKAILGDESSDELNINPSTSAIITLNAKVRNDVNLIDTSHMVSTLSTGVFNDELVYLSADYNSNDISNAKKKDNYKKSVYNFTTKTLTSSDVNPCGSELCNINGDTVHIVGFIVEKPEIHTYLNDIERTTFYDYPIEWRINSKTFTEDPAIVFDGATITVNVPDTLNYLYAETMVNDVRTVKEPSSTNHNQNGTTDYVYTFTEEEIKNGSINTLSIFTDIYLSTKDNTEVAVTATSDFSAYRVADQGIIRLSDDRPSGNRINQANIILKNGSEINTYGNGTPRYVEKGKSYTYTMKAYNNSSSSNGTGYAFENASMYYTLPYIEDINYEIYGKKFTNSSYKIRLAVNPTGYKVYYTKDAAKNVISDLHNTTSPDTHTNWTEWTDPTKDVEATAIKIVKNDNWDIDTFFYSEDGINVIVTPIKNAQADAYYNRFIMTVDRPNGYTPECDPNEGDCSNVTFSSRLYYQSSKSLVEVYSRQISGFVFEDYNYSNMYESGEDQLQNITVELYKLNNENYTEEGSSNPNAYVDLSKDELVSTKVTDAWGAYSFTGLEAGYYYVVFTYDGEKYTPSDKYAGSNGEDSVTSNANQINSKAVALNQVDNKAVSDILTLSSSQSSNSRYNNLGLRIRKEFAVEINKYITSVVHTSSQGVKTFEYDKATKVNIDIKNMKNNKFRVTYSFDIVNTKYFPGYVGVIADVMPTGMTFDNTLEENKDWALYNGYLFYTGLQDKLLLPGDKQYFKLVLDIDTNDGGTYLNVVAVPNDGLILMGEDEYNDVDLNAVDISSGTDTSGTDNTNTGNEGIGD